MWGIMSNRLSVHISAFNSDKYQEKIAALFPELILSISEGRDTHDRNYDCDILIGFGPGLNDEIFERNKNLKFIQALGTGVNGIADRPGLDTAVPVASMRGMHGPQMSELAFMVMLSFNRNFPKTLENQKNHRWERWEPRVLYKKTVGLLGVGLIAEAMAKRCKAFDMKVVGISGSIREVDNIDEMRCRDHLADAVGDLDYLLVLAPMVSKNKNLINAKVLGAMKTTAFLVNISRGGVIDDEAIITALELGQIAGAALDVFKQEPLPQDSHFWNVPNLLITPHNAGMSETYVEQAMPIIEINLRAFMSGTMDKMVNLVQR